MGGEDDLKDIDPVDEIFPDTLRNIPLESPRSSLTSSTRLLDSELGYPPTPDSLANNLDASVNDDRGDSKGMFLIVLGKISSTGSVSLRSSSLPIF